MAVEDTPSLIVLRSHIGYPSPKLTDDARGPRRRRSAPRRSPRPRQSWACPTSRSGCPTTCSSFYREAGAERAPADREAWEKRLRRRGSATAAELRRRASAGTGLPGWEDASCPTWEAGEKVATRQASASVPRRLVDVVPGLIGGGADLTGNTGTAAQRASACSSPESPAAASSTSASASTAWARS